MRLSSCGLLAVAAAAFALLLTAAVPALAQDCGWFSLWIYEDSWPSGRGWGWGYIYDDWPGVWGRGAWYRNPSWRPSWRAHDWDWWPDGRYERRPAPYTMGLIPYRHYDGWDHRWHRPQPGARHARGRPDRGRYRW